VRSGARQGDCAAILFTDGWLEGAADPRTGGLAEGY
jgi:gamma-glutamyltranspeptidase